MARKKGPREFLAKARQRGSEQSSEGIDGTEVRKRLEAKTLKAYQRKIELWNQYTEEHPDASPYDLASLKGFVKNIAYGIDGVEDDPKAALDTVGQYWKEFMAGWRRDNPAIPANTTISVTNFIKGPLADELELPRKKRPRRYATKNHFMHLGKQLWADDWFLYEKPATRVNDWADFMAIVCSSSRVGEYIESSCRAGSGRGLYYKDVTFGVFLNEHGNPEFAVQVVRDAKNMTTTPDKRPEHSLYEGLVPLPLICNPMLPILSKLVAAKAFRDYGTIEELLNIVPPEGEMLHLQWKESVLNTPFFKSMSARDASPKIETANAFSNRLKALGYRAGYPRPPTIHDFRAEGLYWIDKLYSAAQRMKHAGQRDSNTFINHYMPNNSGTDGQASYFGTELRSIVNDLFRGLTLPRNPKLWQSLPAEKQHELENSSEYIAIEAEIAGLKGKKDPDSVARRKELYGQKRTLTAGELRKWQKVQPHRPDADEKDNTSPCYHRTIFNRTRFLMPERERLATTLFEVAALRSSTGLSALRDMIELCQRDAEVEFRPGLEPDKCCCSNPADHRKPTQSALQETKAIYDWRHIYNCYKKSRNDFSELCFQCNKWVFGKSQWSDHCRTHLDNHETLSIQCDPLVYGGVLATAGHCPFCLGDTTLPAAVRMYQFLNRAKWKEHIHEHYHRHVKTLDEGKPARCPHPGLQCVVAFDSVKQLKFHLQDVHCLDFIKEPKALKRSREDGEVEMQPTQVKRRTSRCKKESSTDDETLVKVEYNFIHETVRSISRRRFKKPATPLSCSTSRSGSSSDDTWTEDGNFPDTETPPSSTCSDILESVDPVLLAQDIPCSKRSGTSTTHDAIDVVDLTTVEEYTTYPLDWKDSDVASTESQPTGVTNVEGLPPLECNRPGMKVEEMKENLADAALMTGVAETAQQNHDTGDEECLLLTSTQANEAVDRPPAIDSEDDQWEVERLVAKRVCRVGRRRRVQYLVKWKGYPDDENSWQDEADVGDGLKEAFEARKRPRRLGVDRG